MEPVDLATLIPDGQKVIIVDDAGNSEELHIRPFVWKQFRQVARLVQPIQMHTDENGDLNLMKLVGDHGEEVTDIIVVATGKPKEWVDGLNLTSILPLAAAVLQVNRDFFSQKLGPQLRDLAARLSAGPK
jgi:hypothetical protein